MYWIFSHKVTCKVFHLNTHHIRTGCILYLMYLKKCWQRLPSIWRDCKKMGKMSNVHVCTLSNAWANPTISTYAASECLCHFLKRYFGLKKSSVKLFVGLYTYLYVSFTTLVQYCNFRLQDWLQSLPFEFAKSRICGKLCNSLRSLFVKSKKSHFETSKVIFFILRLRCTTLSKETVT